MLSETSGWTISWSHFRWKSWLCLNTHFGFLTAKAESSLAQELLLWLSVAAQLHWGVKAPFLVLSWELFLGALMDYGPLIILGSVAPLWGTSCCIVECPLRKRAMRPEGIRKGLPAVSHEDMNSWLHGGLCEWGSQKCAVHNPCSCIRHPCG